jgi:hypothetical protein
MKGFENRELVQPHGVETHLLFLKPTDEMSFVACLGSRLSDLICSPDSHYGNYPGSCPVDFRENGQIDSDVLHQHLVSNLPLINLLRYLRLLSLRLRSRTPLHVS